MQWIFV